LVRKIEGKMAVLLAYSFLRYSIRARKYLATEKRKRTYFSQNEDFKCEKEQ
jgi:hypothetical protein